MKKVQITASVRPHLAEWLREEAEANHQSLSLQVDRVLEEAKQRAFRTLTTAPAKAKPARATAAAKQQEAAAKKAERELYWHRYPIEEQSTGDGRKTTTHQPGSDAHSEVCRYNALYGNPPCDPERYEAYLDLCRYVGVAPRQQSGEEQSMAALMPDPPEGLTDAQQAAWRWLYDGTSIQNGIEMVETGRMYDVWFAAELRQLVADVKAKGGEQ